MSETEQITYPDLPAVTAPPPPLPSAPKPPTLAGQLVERLQLMDHSLQDVDVTIDGVAAQVWQGLGSVRVIAIIACVLFGLSLLMLTAILVMVAMLFGHVR